MSNKSLGGEAFKAAALGTVVGYVTTPVTTELYLHRNLAHDTYKLHPRLKAVCWAVTRAMGFNPTAWAVKHRVHHSPLDNQRPKRSLGALVTAVKSGVGTKKHAEEIIANKKCQQHLTFPGFVDKDEILEKRDGALKLRYQNKLDEVLSDHPIVEKLIPLGIAAGAVLVDSLTQKEIKTSFLKRTAHMAGFVLGTFTPALIAASYPEQKSGYETSMHAGKDMGKIGELLFGGYALHASHHAAPHLAEPPTTTMFNRDRPYDMLVQAAGLGYPVDGQIA